MTRELVCACANSNIFKYRNCTRILSFVVQKLNKMDKEKFVCKKCYFITERLENLYIHTKKIRVIHYVFNSTVQEPRSTPQNGFHAKETIDEIIDEIESRDPPVNIRIVISAIITKPSETKLKKKNPAKHSIEFMIVDATETSS